MKQALIITGGYCNTQRITLDINHFFLKIAADSGYSTAKKLGIVPDIIVGDFDSLREPLPSGAQVIRVPAEKNVTDTMLACMTAVEHGAKDILIVGEQADGLIIFFPTSCFSTISACLGFQPG